MTVPVPETPEEIKEFPVYYISFERITELKRSAVTILASRRGPSAPSRLKPDHELDDPQELVDEIAEHSASEDGFIQPDMPIQEIVFRILLSRKNEPTSLHDLHYELTERWATPIRPINVSEDNLERILDGDTYYGFARAEASGN
ncbi:MAG: hypothetical protein ACE5Q6_18125 [Dehalococcoidia bacterium]